MVTMAKIAGFEWDTGNREKCRTHGMSMREVESIFDEDRPVTTFPDAAHSTAETRMRAIGQTHRGRHAFVVFTLREQEGKTYIRPISARYMHKREVAHYEKETETAAPRD